MGGGGKKNLRGPYLKGKGGKKYESIPKIVGKPVPNLRGSGRLPSEREGRVKEGREASQGRRGKNCSYIKKIPTEESDFRVKRRGWP